MRKAQTTKSTPATLLIAFGGTGARTLLDLRRTLQTRYDELPVVSFIMIDPEAAAVSDVPTLYAMAARGDSSGSDAPFIDDIADVSRQTLAEVLRRPERLYRISPLQFEAFVAEFYRAHGFRVWRTKQSHDDGIDLVIERTTAGMQQRFFVQCKHVQNSDTTVGVSAVREIFGVFSAYAASAAVIVTNASFTRAARRFIRRCAYRLFGLDLADILASARKCLGEC